jgi:hypothetical protein
METQMQNEQLLLYPSRDRHTIFRNRVEQIRVITKLPNSEQSNKGKVKTHKYINRQNQSTTGKSTLIFEVHIFLTISRF